MRDVHEVVSHTADAAGLHAPAVTLLLELQQQLGELSKLAVTGTQRGRGPLRPDANWAATLGELGFGVYLLADQTGVDLAAAVTQAAGRLGASTARDADLPF